MEKTKEIIIYLIGEFFTLWGVYLIFTGEITNGLLAIIAGELIDLPQRLKTVNKIN